MKFNFKKIAATFAATALFGMTIGVSAQSPSSVFTQGDTAIIYGAAAPATGGDLVAATNIQSDLGLTATTSGSAGVGSDSVQLKRSTDEFNIGDTMSTFYDKLGGDDDELPSVLADGIYLDDGNDDFEYEQEITLTAATLSHFADRDYEDDEPSIGFHFTNGQAIMNYTLEFTDTLDLESDYSDMETTTIEILGRDYFISTVSSTGSKITLLDAATSTTIAPAETTTVSVGGTAYEVSVSAISDTGAILVVNGQPTNRLAAGDTQKLSDGTHIGVIEFQKAEYAGDTSAFVEFTLGTGEIVLEDGLEVEINGDKVSQIDEYDGFKLNAYTLSSSGNDTIILQWLADDDVFLTPEMDLVMPGFTAIKLTMDDLVSEGSDEALVFEAGDPLGVTTMIEDGEVTIDLFYVNSTNESAFGQNLGTDEDTWLITAAGANPSLQFDISARDEAFVASWRSDGRDAETYYFEVTSVELDGSDNKTTIRNVADGSEVVIKNTENEDVGRLRLTVTGVNPTTETVNISLSALSTGTTYADRVFTDSGLRFMLPIIGNRTSGGAQYVDLDGSYDGPHIDWTMNLTEEDIDGNIASGSSFQIGIDIDTDDGIEASSVTPSAIMLEIPDTDDWVGYVQSDIASMIQWTKDSSGLDSMEVTYHDGEVYAPVYVSSNDAGGSVTTQNVIIKDSEASGNTKNWIVVGGSAVNTVAAQLLGVSFPAHGAAFTEASGVGSGEWLIRTFEHPNSASKVATLIAGYEAGQTTNAASYFNNKDPTIAVGTQYLGTSADSATESVVSA